MQLFYRSYGNGFPLIILHGLFGMSDNWVSIAKKISENRNVIIPDLRNHGQSPHSSTMNYEAMVDDILELANFLNIKEFDLLGHSMGGKIAMNFATEYENMVRKLIIEDIAPKKYHNISIDLLDIMLHTDLSKFKTRHEFDKYLQDKNLTKNYTNLVLKNVQYNNSNGLSWKLNLNAINLNLDIILGEININKLFYKPTLFIKGENSNYINDNDIINLKKYFPICSISSIKQAGHWVHADQSEEFIKQLTVFFCKNN